MLYNTTEVSMQTKTKQKELAKQLRLEGISIIKIADQLGVSKGSVSVWTRGITLTELQREKLKRRDSQISKERAMAVSNHYRILRTNCQNVGKEKIKNGEPLYIAGCMLYWGEGAKDKNICKLVNSELSMLVIFHKFLFTYFNIKNENIQLTINAYTDLHSQEEIENYWLEGLSLPRSCLRKSQWNNAPKSSKDVSRKLEYGTCSLAVCKTEIVQEIFGAIQEFGNFTNPNWLG